MPRISIFAATLAALGSAPVAHAEFFAPPWGPRDIAQHFHLTTEAVRGELLDLHAKDGVDPWDRNELVAKTPILGDVN